MSRPTASNTQCPAARPAAFKGTATVRVTQAGQHAPDRTPKSALDRKQDVVYDSQTDIPRITQRGASCVQRFDDSQIHANRITFRILLRSSSLQEPRDPLLKVVIYYCAHRFTLSNNTSVICKARRVECEKQVMSTGNPSPTHPPNRFCNDPSAGSPTETLLRLLLPLNDQVCPISHRASLAPSSHPKASLSHSIGSSDGRCVQRAGT